MEHSAALLRRGQYVLNFALLFGLALILFLAVENQAALAIFPVVVLVGAAAVFVVRRPLLNLFVLMVALIATSGYSEGITPVEVLHGTYLFSYLVAWFADRVVTEKRIAGDNVERAFLIFLLVLPLTLFITIVLDGSIREYVSEMFALMHLALYFPIRDACRESERGARVVLTAFLVFTTMIAIRNGLEYKSNLFLATADWQVERNRVIENDGLLMSSALFFAAITALGSSSRIRMVGIAGAVISGVGLILTQSRAFWVTFFVGIVLMLFILSARPRRRLVFTMTTGFGLFFALAFLVLKSDLFLILFGLLKRFVSLRTAITDDVSLLNRFRESAAVIREIASNPIVGHGSGVGYLFFDTTRLATDTDSFSHNAYLGLWYKWGLWGVVTLVWFWIHTVRRGFAALRNRHMSVLRRIGLTAAVVAATVYAIPANTSNPFVFNDGLFLFAVLWGIIRGNADAILNGRPQSAKPSE